MLAVFGGSPARKRPFPTWPVFGHEEEERLLRVLRSGNWGRLQGNEVAEFEERFASMHGCRHGIAVANGTVALRIALLAAGIEGGDEVIVPPYTFVATASAVVECNAVPVFADVDLQTFNMTADAMERVITTRTKAVIPVHFAGGPAEMDGIISIARKHGVIVIEDAAHAHGASYKHRPAGSLGDLACFSFQSSKNLTAGEGGIITTNDDAMAERCRSIQNCGRLPNRLWYEHFTIAGNYRLGEFQGAVLNGQLDRLEEQTRTRDANGRDLTARLAGLAGIHPQARGPECTRHSYHLFMLRFDLEMSGVRRESVIAALEAEGIPCSGGYGFSLPDQPMFRDKAFGPYLSGVARRLDYAAGACPNSDRLCREAIWLGQNLLLGSSADVDDIARAFQKIHDHRDALTRERPLPDRAGVS